MQDGPVLLFDGVCNLCNGTVQFLIKRDRDQVFRFASLQSEAAQRLLSQHAPGVEFPDSMILWQEGSFYTQSTAVLRAVRILGGIWRWLYTLSIWVPIPVRDWVYRRVAGNRYRWFGKREQCMLPAPEFQNRFLS